MCEKAYKLEIKHRSIDDIEGISSKLDIFEQTNAIASRLFIEDHHDCHELHDWCTWKLRDKTLDDLEHYRADCERIWNALRADDRLEIIADSLREPAKLAFWLGILDENR